MEKLIVRDFISISQAQIEIKDFNIIIGPQASGKSILMKLIYYFKQIPHEVFKYFQNNKSGQDLDEHLKNKFISYFPLGSLGSGNFVLEYHNGNFYVQLRRKPHSDLDIDGIELTYSDNLKGGITLAKRLMQESENEFDTHIDFIINTEKKYFSYVQENLARNLSWGQIFVPAGRSFFSNLQANIFTFLNSNQSIDPFLAQFGAVYEGFKKIYNNPLTKKHDEKIDKYVYEILKAHYKRDNDEDFLIHQDKRKVNILNASSGQQEILPLLLILSLIKRVKFLGGGAIIYIEEPEAHLFPEAQYKIIKLLAYIFNTRKPPIQIFISTHSPYLLSSVNNLMYASQLYEKFDNESKREQIMKFVPIDEFLSSQKVAAYAITYQNVVESIISPENKLITETFLDHVSDVILETFDNLLNLDDYE